MKKYHLICSIIFIYLLISCSGIAKNDIDTNYTIDSVAYLPMYGDGEYPVFAVTVEGIVNDGASGYFKLDTGMKAGVVQLDSTFFYNNVGTTNMVFQGITQRGSYYKGEIKIRIGSDSFLINEIFVENYKHTRGEGYPLVGLLGNAPFLDKYTILDIDNNRIAFTDSLMIDSSYTAIQLHPLKGTNVPEDFKYVQVEGFKDKDNSSKTGYFLFDTGNELSGIHLKTSFGDNISIKSVKEEGGSLMWNMDWIEMPPVRIKNVSARMIKRKGNRFEVLKGMDGLVGMPLILKFNLILDYKHNILYLKPSKYFNTDFERYMSGNRVFEDK